MNKFFETENHSQLMVRWLERGQAFIQDGDETVITNLTMSNKRNILKGLCSMSSVQQVAKLSLMQQILGDDKSDEAVQTRIYCLAAMPDPESKKDAWNKLQNADQAKMSQKEMEQVIFGFMSQNDQPQLTKKYEDAFFATLYEHYKTSSYNLFKHYIKTLMPRRGEITEAQLDKLRAYLPAQKPQD